MEAIRHTLDALEAESVENVEREVEAAHRALERMEQQKLAELEQRAANARAKSHDAMTSTPRTDARRR